MEEEDTAPTEDSEAVAAAGTLLPEPEGRETCVATVSGRGEEPCEGCVAVSLSGGGGRSLPQAGQKRLRGLTVAEQEGQVRLMWGD